MRKFAAPCLTTRSHAGSAGYAIASTGGRVAVQYFAEGSGRDFAFKCHRRKEAGVDVVYPVNALAFHPTWATAAVAV